MAGDDIAFSGAYTGHLTSGTHAVYGLQRRTTDSSAPTHTACYDGTLDKVEIRQVDIVTDTRLGVTLLVSVGDSGQPRAPESWIGHHDVGGASADPGITVRLPGLTTDYTGLTGSFTVNADGTSGAIAADVGDGPSDNKPVHVRGSWRCP